MPETEAKRKPPRFPYIGALLCAACMGVAVWTWMRYSYCWDVTPGQLDMLPIGSPRPEYEGDWYVGKYSQLHGMRGASQEGDALYFVIDGRGAVVVEGQSSAGSYSAVAVKGRVVSVNRGGLPYFDAGASRFHGASIAGLVVGAMGVFVFTVALRHWLRERRAIMELEAS